MTGSGRCVTAVPLAARTFSSLLHAAITKMRRFVAQAQVLPLFIAMTAACSTDSELASFTSDGCSLFPDASLITADDWCGCCFEHDIFYWKGGTADERKAADSLLRDCVADKTGNDVLAKAMYEGVRLGGSAYFYNWYRWGYGWGYERKYQALTPVEVSTANQLLAEYYASDTADVCDSRTVK